MSWVPAEQVLATVATEKQAVAREEARIASFMAYHAGERQKLEGERQEAVHDLGQAVLPKLTAASIAAAAEAVGLTGLPSEDIPAQLEARRAWLASRLAEITRDPRYEQRELLRHPRTGSLPRALAEAEDFRRPVHAVLVICNEHRLFDQLWSSGFGAPEYKAAWWRYSYWQERSAADELVKKFPGTTTFSEVRDEYARAIETVAVYDADIARLRAELAAGEALEREYATVDQEHRTLDARGLTHTRNRIVQHLLTSDTGVVSQRLRSRSDLLMLFLRASGVTSKIAYLDGIEKSSLGEMQKDLAALKERLAGVEFRTRRRWAPMPLDKFQSLAQDRQPRREKRWQKLTKVYTQVHAYDRWSHGRGYDDLLWWDLMTRGRYDGSFLPEVAQFHHRHPGYAYDPDWKTLAADSAATDDSLSHDIDAAAAVAEADAADDAGDTALDDAGDTQSTDAS